MEVNHLMKGDPGLPMTKTDLQSALAEAPQTDKDRWSISRYAQRHRLQRD